MKNLNKIQAISSFVAVTLVLVGTSACGVKIEALPNPAPASDPQAQKASDLGVAGLWQGNCVGSSIGGNDAAFERTDYQFTDTTYSITKSLYSNKECTHGVKVDSVESGTFKILKDRYTETDATYDLQLTNVSGTQYDRLQIKSGKLYFSYRSNDSFIRFTTINDSPSYQSVAALPAFEQSLPTTVTASSLGYDGRWASSCAMSYKYAGGYYVIERAEITDSTLVFSVEFFMDETCGVSVQNVTTATYQIEIQTYEAVTLVSDISVQDLNLTAEDGTRSFTIMGMNADHQLFFGKYIGNAYSSSRYTDLDKEVAYIKQ